MKKVYITFREMQRRIIDFYNQNKQAIDAIPILKEIFELLLAEFGRFDAAWEIMELNYSGSTITKRNIKSQLAARLSKCHLLLYNYCIKTENKAEINNFNTSEARLFAISSEHLLAKARYTIAYLDALGETLSETAVTAEELADLKTLSDSYQQLIPRPKELQTKKKLANQDLSKAYLASQNLISDRLDKVMKSLFEQSKPEFYNAYREASAVEKVATSKLAVRGSIIDKQSKLPVPQAHLIIESIDFDHEVTGKKGGFRIDKLEPGTYTLKIEAVTYKTITMDLVHRHGETNVVKVEMEAEESITN